jgi:signal transduction histidine kinase
MSQSALLPEAQTTLRHPPDEDPDDVLRCPLPIRPREPRTLTSDLCDELEPAGCPLTLLVREYLRFETLLAEARKRADEEIRAREQLLQQTRERLRRLAGKLLHAQEEERRRIAREMHDDWTQRLALLGIDIAKVEKHVGVPEKALPLLRTMQEAIVKLSEDVHTLSRQLHPSILDDLGLVEALRSECASFSRREGIAVVYHPEEGPANVPKDVALCVYRVAQEALRNVAKHAAVNQVWVTLGAVGATLLLRVEDRGIGFDPATVSSEPGLGLSSMGERVRLVQGEFSVTSAAGQGTTVEVRIPLARSDA